MTTSRATGRVFISHSHKDDELVRDLARRLCRAGLEPLVDWTDLPIGRDWRKTVRAQIRSAEAMLILMTPAALSSAWMMAELGMAEGFELSVLPVTAGLKPQDLPAPLQSYHAVPFDEVDAAIHRLSERSPAAAAD